MAEIIDISKTKVCYDLPNSKDTAIFGPAFWDAFHDLASRIPCEGCKAESESFVKFWHDLKNYDLNKPLEDRSNFNLWLDKIETVKGERKRNTDRYLLGFIAIVVTVILVVVLIKTKK